MAEFDPQEFLREIGASGQGEFDPKTFLSELDQATPFDPKQFLAETAQVKPDTGILNVAQQLGNAAVRSAIKGGIASPLQGIGALSGGAEAPDITPGGGIGARIGRAILGPPPVYESLPVQERWPYRAGTAVSDWAERQFPSDRSLHPIVEGVAGGIGQVGSLIGASMIPGVAPVAMGSTLLSGSGEAAERAIKDKATNAQVEQAAKWGNVAGSLDLADFMLSKMGKVGQFVAGTSPSRITRGLMGALVEGGTEGAQEYIQNLIAKNIYKPNQDLWEGVPENAIVGAIVGGAASTVLPQHKPEVPPQAEDFKAVEERLSGLAQSPEAQAYARGGVQTQTAPQQMELPLEQTSQPVVPPVAEQGQSITQFQEPISGLPRLPDEPPGPVFYSKLRQVVEEKVPNSATPKQIRATIEAAGVKQEEIDSTEVGYWLALQEGGKVSKSEMLAFLEERAIQVHTIEHTPSQYAGFMAPGPTIGQSRDVLLVLPEKADTRSTKIQFTKTEDLEGGDLVPTGIKVGPDPNYQDPHWEELNVVSHAQIDTRVDKAGQVVAVVNGIQSKWAAEGRKFGFRDAAQSEKEVEYYRLQGVVDQLNQNSRELYAARQRVAREMNSAGVMDMTGSEYNIINKQLEGISVQINDVYDQMRALNVGEATRKVPDLPFKGNWLDLTIKRLMRWAADEGYSRIGFVNADLAILYNTGAGGIISKVDSGTQMRLTELYDRIIPSRLKKYAKEFGGVLGETEIDLNDQTVPMAIRSVESSLGGMRFEVYNTDTNQAIRSYGTRRGAETFINMQETPRTEKIYFVDLPPEARAMLRTNGVAMFQEPIKPISLGGQSRVKVTSTPEVALKTNLEFQVAVEKTVNAFDTFVKKFGFENRIRLDLQWNDGKGAFVNGQYRGYGALNTSIKAGSYVISIDLSTMKGVTQLYTILMHEFGHAVFWEHYSHLPLKQQQAILAEYDKYFNETFNAGGTTLDMLQRREAAALLKLETSISRSEAVGKYILDLPFEKQMYHMGFEEWFADRVAKWATSEAKPLGIVDKTFAELGRKLREYYSWMLKKLGIDARADRVMSEWLDSFLVSSNPQIHVTLKMRQDLHTKVMNQRALASGDRNVELPEQRHQLQPVRDAMETMFKDSVGGVPRPVKEAAGHADRMNKLYEYAANLLQLVQANPFFTPLLRYAEKVGLWHLDESKGHNATLEVSKDWRRLGKQSENLVALIDDLVQMKYLTPDEVSRGVVRQYTLQEFQALVAKHKVSAAGVQMHERLTKYFNDFLTLTSDVAKKDVLRRISDPVLQGKKLDEINAQIANLKNRPYFPFMHFGRHFVTVRDVNDKIMHFETFERHGIRSAESQQAKREAEMVAAYGRDRVKVGVLHEHIAPLIGMPSTLLERVKEELQLTPEQLEALELLQFEHGPSLSFKHRFKNPTYVPGYSHDFQRSFAKFGFHASRYLARIKWGPELQQHIAEAKAVSGIKESKIANYMSDHMRNNVLDARGDFGVFKAAVFIYAMGYVPAAATQNLLQTPIVTLPYLGAKFGDVRAAAALGNVMRQVSTFTRKGKLAGMTEFEMQALGYAISTGRVSETQAAELMAISGGGNLVYATGGNWFQRGMSQVLEKAGWMFEIAEQFNRRIAFRAALNLAMQSPNAGIVNEAVRKYPDEHLALTQGTMIGGKSVKYTDQQARAIVTANHVVEQTQFVYASYNRPKLMRGPIGSTVFIFKTYIQNLFALAGQNKRDFLPRFVVMSLLLGGAKALPGYDDLEDLVKALMRWMGHTEDPETSLRRYIGQLTSPDGADLVLNGMARRGFGVPAMLDLMGSMATGVPGRGLLTPQPGTNIPFPILDRSKSVSPGPLLPIQIGKIVSGYGDPDKPIAEETQRAAGAGFSVGFNIIRAIADNSYEWNDPKRYERAVPRALGWASKTYRAYSEGRERMRGGVLGAPTLTSYDPRDTEQLGEMIAMAMGYNNLRTTQHWDIIMAQRDQTKGLAMKREHLMKQFDEARRGGYEQELDKMRDAIVKWNTGLSDEQKGYSISSDQLRQSIVTRERDKILREMGLSAKKREIPVIRELQEIFPKWQTNPPVDAVKR